MKTFGLLAQAAQAYGDFDPREAGPRPAQASTLSKGLGPGASGKKWTKAETESLRTLIEDCANWLATLPHSQHSIVRSFLNVGTSPLNGFGGSDSTV
jgi:hypothetical protein